MTEKPAVNASGKARSKASRGGARMLMLALAASIAVTALPLDDAQAQRRTLLEQWFADAAKRAQERRMKRLRRTNPELFAADPEPAPIKKITGPRYYTYKTEKLASFSLAGLLPEPPAPAPMVRKVPLLGEDDLGVPTPAGVDLSKTGAIKPVSPKLTEASLTGWSMTLEGGIAAALKEHYSKQPDYLWVGSDLRPNEKASDLLAIFSRADEFGLTPQDYQVSLPQVAANREDAEGAAARFELALSAAALRYAADADAGRINPNKISGYHDFPGYGRDYKAQMSAIADNDDPAAMLESLHPANERFASLMAELAELRASVDEDDIEPIKPGTLIKPGQEHEELPKIIELIRRKASDEFKTEHAAVLASYDGALVFGEELVKLIKAFQKESGLGADGIVGRNTIAKLQGESPKAKIAKIELAMERLRWLPDDLGSRHVLVNQPAYRATYVNGGKVQLAMNVVVGKPSNQTSFFSDTIEVVEVNPYWNVPRSILVNEMLGKIRANPGYLSARNYEVVSGGKPRDPHSVDWYSPEGYKSVYIRQRPGSGNALGELKILFPNEHAIYMHDTPAKKLFSRSRRAYSHGCIRLADPRAMAAAVLQTSQEQVGNYIAGGQNRSIPVKNKLPVYVSYFTAWPDDEGNVGYYADVYGRDKALIEALERTREMRLSAGAIAES
ncbi:L,D-transpeptidase family protein [Salaquimonas pukyongi]|uniref:L,D-transpeptidase family protein n=1 Tax=Salaquimonas pukyongi TaxID=2712698 RepID=UPI0013BE9AFB|nr:L,D-transpeptidase family protein [Salaquimonas pukyongi]